MTLQWFVDKVAIEQDVEVTVERRVVERPIEGDEVELLCRAKVARVIGDEVEVGPLSVTRILSVKRVKKGRV